MNRKWNSFVNEARIDQIIYEVTFIMRYKSESESLINLTKIKDEIRSIENVTVVRTTEETQILSGYEYRDLVLKVALSPTRKIKDELLQDIVPKIKEIKEITLIKLASIERISER